MVAHTGYDVRILALIWAFVIRGADRRRSGPIAACPASSGWKRLVAVLCAEYVLKFLFRRAFLQPTERARLRYPRGPCRIPRRRCARGAGPSGEAISTGQPAVRTHSGRRVRPVRAS